MVATIIGRSVGAGGLPGTRERVFAQGVRLREQHVAGEFDCRGEISGQQQRSGFAHVAAERPPRTAQQFVAAALSLQHPPRRSQELLVVRRVARAVEAVQDRHQPDMILRRVGHGPRERGECVSHPAGPALRMGIGNQAEQEHGLLERIGDIVGALEQVRVLAPLRLALRPLARLHHQMVGPALPDLRA